MKVLDVLRLFGEEQIVIRAVDIERRLRVSSATAYRCIHDLLEAGLLEPAGAGAYGLGPTIVELDRQIRIHDPLVAAADEIMHVLSARSGGTVLLCRRHGLKVLCVHQVAGRLAPSALGFERGRAMPLYRGATSKAILGHVDTEILRELIEHDAEGLRKAGLPVRFGALVAHRERWRAAKVVITSGEVDPAARGYAVPLFQGKHLVGSLSIVLANRLPERECLGVPDMLIRAALRLEARLETH